DVSKRPPEATHCTHIGKIHREMIHPAIQRWFGIDMTTEKEFTGRLAPEKLRCWTPEAERELKPRKLVDLLAELADARMTEGRKTRDSKAPDEQRRQLQAEWSRILGNVQPIGKLEAHPIGKEKVAGATIERILLKTDPGITVPLLLLLPRRAEGKK